MPAPTVRLVSRSMMMNAPVVAVAAVRSNASGWLSVTVQRPISFSASAGGVLAVQRVDVDAVAQRG